jgi:hypothetical protein
MTEPDDMPPTGSSVGTVPGVSDSPTDPNAGETSSSGLPVLPQFGSPTAPAMEPFPKPTLSVGEPTSQEIQQLSQAISSARTALEDNQIDQALEHLQEVEQLPMRQEDLDRYQRLQLLAQYVRNFRTTLGDAIAALQGGDEIPVGTSTVVGVVETAEDQITVRVAGANRTYAIDDLPVGLAVAIAEQRLDDSDPVSLVLKASYLAALKNARADQLAKAREWFREAKQRGAPIGDLEKVLDDS